MMKEVMEWAENPEQPELSGQGGAAKKAPPPSDQFKKATSGVMIFGVCFEMISQITDPLTQYRNLDFRRTCVAAMCLIRADKF